MASGGGSEVAELVEEAAGPQPSEPNIIGSEDVRRMEVLGAGGFGIVYRGVWKRGGETELVVAIKTLTLTKMWQLQEQEANTVAQFEKEAQLLIPLDHEILHEAMSLQVTCDKYLRRELPQLSALEPRLVVVPPVEDSDIFTANHREDTHILRVFQAERKVVLAVKGALEDVCRENPHLHVVCFHGLRFGIGHVAVKYLHWDLADMVVMCVDARTGARSLMFIEVPGMITQAKDIVGRTRRDGSVARATLGVLAMAKLHDHIAQFLAPVEMEQCADWVTPVLALPSFPEHVVAASAVTRDDPTVEEESVQQHWNEFFSSARANNSDDWTAQTYAQIARMRPRLLTRSVLESPEGLKRWLEEVLRASMQQQQQQQGTADGEMEAVIRRTAYSSVLATHLVHCFGIALSRLSRSIDNNKGSQDSSIPIALLTDEQRRAYDTSPNHLPLLLIVGAAGTGKTLLALSKLVKCERDGIITSDKRGLFLTHKRNVGLMALAERHLRVAGAQFIQIRAVDDEENLVEQLRSIKKNKEGRNFSMAVLDQLEDMFDPYSDRPAAADNLLDALMNIEDFDLFWVTVNPFDIPFRHHRAFQAYLERPEVSARRLTLNARVRNTAEIGFAIDRADSSSAFSLPLRLGAEPAALARPSLGPSKGAPMFTQYHREDASGGRHASLARVLRFLLRSGVSEERIVVVRTSDSKELSLPSEVDPHLISLFGDDGKAAIFFRGLTSSRTAPLLVQAAWTGNIQNSLDREELERTRRLVRRSLLGPLGRLDESSNTRGPLLVQGFRKCLDNYTKERAEWSTVMRGPLRNSVSLHATMSLVARGLALAQKYNSRTTNMLLGELAEAITDAYSTDPLKELIARHPCVSVLTQSEVGGYEADVVVVCDFENALPAVPIRFYDESAYTVSRLMSRAKVMCVLLADENCQSSLEQALGPIPTLLK